MPESEANVWKEVCSLLEMKSANLEMRIQELENQLSICSCDSKDTALTEKLLLKPELNTHKDTDNAVQVSNDTLLALHKLILDLNQSVNKINEKQEPMLEKIDSRFDKIESKIEQNQVQYGHVLIILLEEVKSRTVTNTLSCCSGPLHTLLWQWTVTNKLSCGSGP